MVDLDSAAARGLPSMRDDCPAHDSRCTSERCVVTTEGTGRPKGFRAMVDVAAQQAGGDLTTEELLEIRRMLSCAPQYDNERVALSAVGKLVTHYLLAKATEVPPRASQEPGQ